MLQHRLYFQASLLLEKMSKGCSGLCEAAAQRSRGHSESGCGRLDAGRLASERFLDVKGGELRDGVNAVLLPGNQIQSNAVPNVESVVREVRVPTRSGMSSAIADGDRVGGSVAGHGTSEKALQALRAVTRGMFELNVHRRPSECVRCRMIEHIDANANSASCVRGQMPRSRSVCTANIVAADQLEARMRLPNLS